MKKRANDMAEQPMKVLVVSDVHGRVTPLRWLLKNETADALFFLGDGLYDLDQAIAANGAAPRYAVFPGTVQPRQPAGYPQLWRDHHHGWTVQF